MITYIRVRNLAIVEEVTIEPEAGLNVLTGETGAGKSLLIDSLQFLSGARASTELIRTGTDKLSAEAVFQLPEALLRQLAPEAEDQELIIKREISTGGRGRVLLNGSVVSVRELTASLERILEIHGQSESHDRIAGASFREVLDLYAGNEPLLSQTATAFGEWQRTEVELNELTKAEKDRLLRTDLLKFQIDEISKARLAPAEEETLRSERAILANARQIAESSSAAFAILSDDDQAALPQIARAAQFLHPLSRSVEEVKSIADQLEDLRIRLEEVVRELSAFAESARQDPQRLEEVEDRLATIERLKRKYGSTVEEILTHFAAISEEYEKLQEYDLSLANLQKKEQTARTLFEKHAMDLSKRRRTAAPNLEKAIHKELRDLAMEKTKLTMVISDATAGTTGMDRVDLLIAPNPGEELRPLSRVASGGELSRIQLAIAAAVFKHFDRSAAGATLVFDEIDSGIGGRIAEVVGRKLRELASKNQVICVTHLPQIASFATTHFRVWKEEAKGRTRARIEKLEERESRVEEIARMLGGEKVSASAIAHARELLAPHV